MVGWNFMNGQFDWIYVGFMLVEPTYANLTWDTQDISGLDEVSF